MELINFSIEEDSDSFSLARKALVFVEGTHKDSMGREHSFNVGRIKEFVDNTNNFLRQGGRLPFQLDHKKTQDFNIGDVEGELYIKTISEEDLPNPTYRHLLGKAGVFVDQIIGKGKDTVQKIKDGLIKTLSPGLDPMTKSFIEISATPTPAIIGPALFSKTGDLIDNYILFTETPLTPNISRDSQARPQKDSKEKVYSYDQLMLKKQKEKQKEDQFEEEAEALYEILNSIHSSTEEELAAQGINPVNASYEAIEYFLSNLEKMFDLVDDKKEDDLHETLQRGSVKFPIGKQSSDYNRERKLNTLNFKKNLAIGFVLQ